ncbi:MAG: SMP-30/gluconolactonase/LRE family protein [Thermomicrobiales bacterium]|nr:SMP-30/gluconolactonase/LRE family protein [Thermomicrobiales bacterium]
MAAVPLRPEPEMIADTLCKTGEGPMWHPVEKRVYWVDIPNGTLYRYDPDTGEHEQFLQSGVIGGYTFQADGGILLFQERGAIRLYKNGELTTIVEEIPEEREGRFNDVIADPEGRVYCGTMPIGDRPGKLYRLERDGSLHVAFEDAGLSNGIGFSPDLSLVYHSDSDKRLITRSRYNRSTGELTERTVWHRTKDGDGLPDGMTVDADGYVWSAQWDGSCLLRLDLDGNEVDRVTFPANKVSSIIFGGEDYLDAYVTTANVNGRETEGPGAGALFRVQLGVAGKPEFFSRIGL